MKLGRYKINLLFLLVAGILALSGLYRELIAAWSVLIYHEAAHILVLRKLGLDFREVEILPFGGVARVEGLLSPREEMLTAMAGPSANLVLGFLFFVLGTGPWGQLFLQVNLVLAVTNLLPALPLDGGRVLRAFLSRSMGHNRATAVVIRFSRILAIIIGIISLLLFLLGLLSLLSLFLAFFVYHRSGMDKEELLTLRLVDIMQRAKQLKGTVLPGEIWAVTEDTRLKDIIPYLNPRQYHQIFVLGADLELKGIIQEGELVELVSAGRLQEHLRDIVDN